MNQAYSDPKREIDPHALPDVEVFYLDGTDDELTSRQENGEPLEAGWYWWPCLPGCLPDGEPSGPYDSEAEAIAAAQDDAGEDS